MARPTRHPTAWRATTATSGERSVLSLHPAVFRTGERHRSTSLRLRQGSMMCFKLTGRGALCKRPQQKISIRSLGRREGSAGGTARSDEILGAGDGPVVPLDGEGLRPVVQAAGIDWPAVGGVRL